MNRRFLLPRSTALWLTASLLFSSPALALRSEAPEEVSPLKETLIRRLKPNPAAAPSAGLTAGLEEGIPELSLKLRDAGRAFEELSKSAARLAELGSAEALGALNAVLADEQMPAKNRAAAAVGLGLHGDTEHLKDLLEALISIGASGQSKKAVATIAISLSWLNYDRSSDVEFVSDFLEKVQGQSGINLREARPALVVHGARLNYQEVLAGRPIPPTYVHSLQKIPSGQVVLAQLQAEPQQRKAWAAVRLGELKTPFAIPALRQVLEAALDQDPQSGDPGMLDLQVAAAVALSQAVSASAGLLDHGPMVRRLKQEAIDFSLRRLAPEGIQNSILRQAVETHWPPIWKSRPAAGLEEGESSEELRRYLETHSYPGGPIQMIADEFEKSGPRIVILGDAAHWLLSNTTYAVFLERLIEQLVGKLDIVFVEKDPLAVEGRLLPWLRRWRNSGIRDYATYAASLQKELPPRGRPFSRAVSHTLPMLRTADEREIPIVGFDLRWDNAEGRRTLPSSGGETERKFVQAITARLGPESKALVLMGGGHATKNETLNRTGYLLSKAVGSDRVTAVWMDVGWDWADMGVGLDLLDLWKGDKSSFLRDNRLRPLLRQTDLPFVAVTKTLESPLAGLQLYQDYGVVFDYGERIDETKEQPIPVRVKDFDRLIYFRSQSDVTDYVAHYNPRPTAGLEERLLGPDEFLEEYGKLLQSLQGPRREQITGWLGMKGVQIREVELPDWVTLHVRGGSDFLRRLQAVIQNLEGTLFEWRPASDSDDPAAWGKVGMILNDLERLGPYIGPNPNGLPVRNLLPEEIGQLNALRLLAEIFAPLPPGSVFLGAELFPDSNGKTRLLLFSA